MNLSYYKDMLLKEKSRVENIIERVDDNSVYDTERNHVSMRESTGELSAYDNHPGDMGSEVFTEEMNMNLRDNEKSRLYEINMALERIDRGTYGVCEKCSSQIEEERLDIVPEAALCSSCSNLRDKLDKRQDYRPIEEDLLDKNDYFYADIVEDLADINRNEEHDQVEDGF